MTLKEWFETNPYPSAEENLAADASLFLKKGAGRSLKAGGAWIYDNEVDRTEGSFENGAILRILDFDGYPLGYGFINTLSKIRVRMLSRYEKSGVTPSFLRRRLEDAWNYRKAVIDTNCCRAVFGEADFLPGLTVDKFGDVLVVESLALGTDRLKTLLLRQLTDILEEDGCRIRGIYERSDAKVRQLEGLARVKGFIGPAFDTNVRIRENGVSYIVDVKDGQKTGFFLDQKNNRAAAAEIVRKLSCLQKTGAFEQSPGPSVLDCFTHTGSFGLNCALAGAGSVLSVDASKAAIRQAMENARLNGLSPVLLGREDAGSQIFSITETERSGSAAEIRYLTADIFELLPKLEQEGKQYDMVILDPPAFTKSRQATKNAVKGYREINLRGMRLVKDGGFLATCSCSHFMTEELFEKTLKEASHGARRRLRQVQFLTQAPDHPILWGDDESYYLKFYLFQVLRER